MNENNVIALLRAASMLIRHCDTNNISIRDGNTDFRLDLLKAVENVEGDFDPWILDQDMEPYEFDKAAYEFDIDGTWYRWDDEDYVHRHDPSHPLASEDGFVRLGKAPWPDVSADTEVDIVALVRDFVNNWKE